MFCEMSFFRVFVPGSLKYFAQMIYTYLKIFFGVNIFSVEEVSVRYNVFNKVLFLIAVCLDGTFDAIVIYILDTYFYNEWCVVWGFSYVREDFMLVESDIV